MQNNKVTEITKKAAVIPEKVKLYALLHKEQDFTALYNFLLSKYQGREDCPALLLLDDCNPSIIKDRNGLEAVILDRNSDNLKREIKNIIRKPGVVTDCKALETFWASDNRYDILYRLVLDIKVRTSWKRCPDDWLEPVLWLLSPGGSKPSQYDQDP